MAEFRSGKKSLSLPSLSLSIRLVNDSESIKKFSVGKFNLKLWYRSAFSFSLSALSSVQNKSFFIDFKQIFSFYRIYAVFECVFMTGANHLYYKLDQYWHNYKGDEFFCSLLHSLSLLIFIIHFLYSLTLFSIYIAARYHFFDLNHSFFSL